MIPIRLAKKSILKRRLAQVSKGLTLGIVGALTFALPTSNNAQAQDQRPAADPELEHCSTLEVQMSVRPQCPASSLY